MRGLLEGWGEAFEGFGDGGGPLAGGGVAEVHAVGAGFSGDVAGGEGAGIDGLEIQFAGGFFDPAVDGFFDGGSVFGGVGGEDPNDLHGAAGAEFADEGADDGFVGGALGVVGFHEFIHPIGALLDDDEAGSEAGEDLVEFRGGDFFGFVAVMIFGGEIFLWGNEAESAGGYKNGGVGKPVFGGGAAGGVEAKL